MAYFQNASNECLILKGPGEEWKTLTKLPFNLAASAATSHGDSVFIVGGLASNPGLVITSLVVVMLIGLKQND